MGRLGFFLGGLSGCETALVLLNFFLVLLRKEKAFSTLTRGGGGEKAVYFYYSALVFRAGEHTSSKRALQYPPLPFPPPVKTRTTRRKRTMAKHQTNSTVAFRGVGYGVVELVG